MADRAPNFVDSGGIERFWYAGKCHCGAVKFQVAAGRKLTITLCNCSICYITGHQELMVPDAFFKIMAGEDHLRTYLFGTKTAQHTFCMTCGVKPFFRPRSHPVGYRSVNARCLELGTDVQIEYEKFDGQNWERSIAAGLHKLTC